MDIITQQAEALQAGARAEKAKAEALAQVEETRAIEEVAKTQKIVRAEASLEQAKLDRLAAVETKQRNILLGQGEAERKRLNMQADGALQPKLDAWVKSQEFWASASKTWPSMVPSIVMGGGDGKGAGFTSTDFMSILGMKAAQDISLDMSVPSGTRKK